MRLLLFWGALALVIYAYLIFPLLVLLRGVIWRQRYHSAPITPTVSLIIAAYNEAHSIRAKLENVLAMNYPHARLEVLVASDGSHDGTNEIVQEYADRGIRLLALPRQGKAAALNTAVAIATGDILVFSDANSMYVPDAIHALARPFADPTVGGVAGNQCYIKQKYKRVTNAGEHSYWNFDRKLKELQSEAGNAISATGAIYAIRRSLFQPAPAGVTDDFTISTGVIAQGYRLVFAPDAIAYEEVAASSRTEFGRKVRVMTRGLRAVVWRRELLNPFRYGFYSLQLFSHKVVRRLVVLPLLVLLLVSPLLWSMGPFYQLATLAQAAFYSCGAIGVWLGDSRLGKQKIFALPAFFCMVNAAALLATMNLVRGHRIERWEPQRPDVQTKTTAL